MTRLNLFGATFTISLLMTALIFAVWRAVVYQQELIDCYKKQLLDAVTILDTKTP